MATFDVAVIGLGAMGSAALFNLAHQGRRVIGIEQFEPGHDKGSSHGESRIIRLSYFEHPSYVPLARRALEKWRALEQLCGKTLLTVTGMLEAGYSGLSSGRGLARGLAAARASNTRFSAPPRSTGASPPSAFRRTGRACISRMPASCGRSLPSSNSSRWRSGTVPKSGLGHAFSPSSRSMRGFACAQMTA